MGAREYDPSLGRWLSADTIVPDLADPQSLNRYSYVSNNPLRYVDPSGHEGEEPPPGVPPEDVCARHGHSIPSCAWWEHTRSGHTVLTLKEAQETFEWMAAQPDIAFAYPQDGCYARAHLMVQRMQDMGITPAGKAWTFMDPDGDQLWVETSYASSGRVEWWYHVAPTVWSLQNNGTIQRMVIDPSLFDEPATVEEWADIQHNAAEVIMSDLGEPPNPKGWPDRSGGSGYWPGADPSEGLDAHAQSTMTRYRKRQSLTPRMSRSLKFAILKATRVDQDAD